MGCGMIRSAIATTVAYSSRVKNRGSGVTDSRA